MFCKLLLGAMVVTPNPHATDAALETLKKGGNAVDAAIAAQLVLNVVEPHCSGIGGGAFLLFSDKHSDVTFYDGREKAPLAPPPVDETAVFTEIGGNTVGVPGLLALCHLAHQEKGKLPWSTLFEPAIAMAKKGKKNLVLAETLSVLGREGIAPFYTGPIADQIVDKISRTKFNPGNLTKEDLASYQAIKRKPIIFEYNHYKIVGAPPPSSGGMTIAEILGLLENRNLHSYDLGSFEFINLFCQASQLAFLDRKEFLADPDFFAIPMEALLDKLYLKKRSTLLNRNGVLQDVASTHFDQVGAHLSLIDDEGNCVALSSTIGGEYGAKLNVVGFCLNNSLCDFSGEQPNAREAGKRPLSSMAPLFVFDKATQKLLLVIGSSGGAYTIDYVAQALFGLLEFGMDVQGAIDYPHAVAIDEKVLLEKGTFLETLYKPFKALGHPVKLQALESGTNAIWVTGNGEVQGGTDHRGNGSVGYLGIEK